MPEITSLEGLGHLKDELLEKRDQEVHRGATFVTVGMAACGIAAGALEVLKALEDEIHASHRSDIVITRTGCIGLCRYEPIVEVVVGDAPRVAYGNVDPAVVKRIVQEHILDGKAVDEFVIDAAPFPTI